MRVKRSITIEKDVWESVKEEAKKNNRSASNQVEWHIKQSQQYEWELKKILEKSKNDRKY